MLNIWMFCAMTLRHGNSWKLVEINLITVGITILQLLIKKLSTFLVVKNNLIQTKNKESA